MAVRGGRNSSHGGPALPGSVSLHDSENGARYHPVKIMDASRAEVTAERQWGLKRELQLSEQPSC
jgi:hypothetical protein